MKKKSNYWIFHFWEISNEFFNTQTVLFYKPVGGMPSWSSRCSLPCSSSSTKSMPCPIMCLHRWVSIKKNSDSSFWNCNGFIFTALKYEVPQCSILCVKLFAMSHFHEKSSLGLHYADTWSSLLHKSIIVCRNWTFLMI